MGVGIAVLHLDIVTSLHWDELASLSVAELSPDLARFCIMLAALYRVASIAAAAWVVQLVTANLPGLWGLLYWIK
jgi:hypothetical protein